MLQFLNSMNTLYFLSINQSLTLKYEILGLLQLERLLLTQEREWEEFLMRNELFVTRQQRKRSGGVHQIFHLLLKAMKLSDKEQLIISILEKEYLSLMAGVDGTQNTDSR